MRIRNQEATPFTFIVEPWGAPVEIVPNQMLFIVGTGKKYSSCPEVSIMDSNVLICTLYCEEVGVYYEDGSLYKGISGHAPINVVIDPQ